VRGERGERREEKGEGRRSKDQEGKPSSGPQTLEALV